MDPTRRRNGWNRQNTQHTPKTLNSMWARAVRFAETLATEAAILEVMVVPMFSPRTIAAAISKGIYPLATRTMVMAIVAAEDWSISVIKAPVTMNIRIEPMP